MSVRPQTAKCYEKHFQLYLTVFLWQENSLTLLSPKRAAVGTQQSCSLSRSVLSVDYVFNDLGRGTEETFYHSNGLFFISFKIRHKYTFSHQIHRFWNYTSFLPLQWKDFQLQRKNIYSSCLVSAALLQHPKIVDKKLLVWILFSESSIQIAIEVTIYIGNFSSLVIEINSF